MTTMKCPQCRKEDANIDGELGILPGNSCQKQNAGVISPSQAFTYDFASPKTKADRKEYASEMFQPWVNGVLSKEFIEANGTEKLAGITEKDIKNAKYVYKGISRHHKMVEDGVQKRIKRYGMEDLKK